MAITVSDPKVALAVINEAKANGVFGGEIPEDDAALIKEAGELVRLAEQAVDAGVAGGAVEKVLAAANGTGDEGGGEAAADNPFAAAAAAEAEPETDDGPDEGTFDIDSVIEDYEDLKVAEILEAMKELDAEQVAQVKAYEAENGERAKILNYVAAEPEPDPEPESEGSDEPVNANVDPSNYATTEPWPGYNKAKIGDIVAKIEDTVRNDGENAKPLLAHVWEFEKNGKGRKRLIDKLTDIATNGVTAEPEDVKTEPPFDDDEGKSEGPVAPPVQTKATAPVSGDTGTLADPVPGGATPKALGAIEKEGLPIPAVVGEIPVLPEDFTTLSDIEVRRFQSQFHACYARAHFIVAVCNGHSNDAKVVAEDAIREYINANDFPKGTTVTQMEAQASADESVQQARQVEREWREAGRLQAALRDIYLHACERLSREQTGRDAERAR